MEIHMLFSGLLEIFGATVVYAAEQVAAAPITGVEGGAINGVTQNSQHAADGMSFIHLFLQADMVVKLVMVMLMIASIWSWAIIFEKLISFRTIRRKMAAFEKEFWTGVSFDRLFKQLKGKEDHPMAMVFTAALDELQVHNISGTATGHATASERVRQAMQVSANKAMDLIERNLNFLATVGSSAPFIGLFGTVWGIMVSFQSIAASKNTTLAVVAPGIAEALLATALGLMAAIPAVIFYNKFAAEVNKINNQVHDFSIELSNMILRELDK